MKTSKTVWWVVGAVIIIGLVGWAVTRIVNSNPSELQGTPVATSTVATSTQQLPNSGGQTSTTSSVPKSTYANATYNFSIAYPKTLTSQNFGVFHMLNNHDWRVNATPAKRGTAVISIPVIQWDNETQLKRSYPLYFGAEVRVGVSTDVTQCYAKDDGYANQTVTNVTINGVTWKKFIFGDAAMMQYENGASYRTIRANKCYVVEQVRVGSSYRDDTMTVKYTDKQLDAFYAQTTPIVMSFKFLK